MAGIGRRKYHDEATFGYRVPAKYTLPDYTQEELDNRNANAPLLRYVEMFRKHGHRAARVDPLDLMNRDEVAALSSSRYGLDSSTSYPLQGILHVPSSSSKPQSPKEASTAGPPRTESGEGTDVSWNLEKITEHLMRTYVDRIGYEYIHCPDKDERLWFSHHIETNSSSFPSPLRAEQKKRIWELLSRSEQLDRFLGKKFPNLKRYGCEGAESMLPALGTLFELSAKSDISSVIVSLPHRGRLSMLCDPDLLSYSPTALFSKIKGRPEFDPSTAPGATGDVISHLSAVKELKFGNRKVEVEVLQNPSHLEAVNPVALGVTRAKQMSLIKTSPADCQLGDRVLCVQLHGDAAFAGQGVVAESLGLSGLPHFGSGGTVHIIVNNNIGYTTPASFARSSIYSSDIGKMIGCPILHVNGDYPEAVVRAVDVAFRYRQMFRKDIIIDLICYRRWGHNELDEPAYTQPKMYEKIRSRSSVPELYEQSLIKDGTLSESDVASARKQYESVLEDGLAKVDDFKPESDMLKGKWSKMVWPASKDAQHEPETGVEINELKAVAEASVKVPDSFTVHSRLKRHISARLKSLDAKVDFATAEAMAFGTLMQAGYDIRICGQDVGRGTFSQRHAMLVDQNDESCIIPLNEAIDSSKGRLELANSSLSEMAVLGFEVGMSWARPTLLPIWEAQFGDFMNGAQSMIDTFVIGAQAKWLKQSALIMQLPHGFDGAGPEHSSSRIERFLQVSNHFPLSQCLVNVSIVNPSTPAQLFHLLRRQMLRNYRKPLIIASPKGLLRSPVAASPLSDMGPSTSFQFVLDSSTNSKDAKTLVLCSGKHYYTLSEALGTGAESIALVRVEELSPFPRQAIKSILDKYTQAKKIVWAQEEPENQGPWPFVRSRLEDVLRDSGRDSRVEYVGRKSCPTVAVAVGEWHKREAQEIVQGVLDLA
ncbi:Thiamin diphosphate-binding protein [Kockovaella imperatae]|uniref:Thiamin diphosphate-binding protein n=1 Tax=Kockovaella imperatae TaxID=4999 RepID=A0A1Y1UGZ4_9TREE|nr:Thiamin diphosphate-binding protein [Kockovaella imperatae]ORX36355.1 Thiamin diphosphate-binding protein [Kockovaella imperatae]